MLTGETLLANKSDQPYQLAPLRQIFIRDLVLPTRIGVHTHERDGEQLIRVSVVMVARIQPSLHDRLENTVCYDRICSAIRGLPRQGHVQLVETFCEQVISLCFNDLRVQEVSVTVEKLEVYEDAGSVGVTMTAKRAG